MQFDRKITISAGSSRRAMVWQAQTLLISELWAKLQTPARGTEPLAEYQAAFLANRNQPPVNNEGGGDGKTD